jgi:hypothetical protein
MGIEPKKTVFEMGIELMNFVKSENWNLCQCFGNGSRTHEFVDGVN